MDTDSFRRSRDRDKLTSLDDEWGDLDFVIDSCWEKLHVRLPDRDLEGDNVREADVDDDVDVEGGSRDLDVDTDNDDVLDKDLLYVFTEKLDKRENDGDGVKEPV